MLARAAGKSLLGLVLLPPKVLRNYQRPKVLESAPTIVFRDHGAGLQEYLIGKRSYRQQAACREEMSATASSLEGHGGYGHESKAEDGMMRAMVLEAPRTPLKRLLVPIPVPGPSQLRVRVLACAVCRTDLHVVDGDLDKPKLPLVPGHEIVGAVDKLGDGVDESRFPIGTRVGIPWLGRTCGRCSFCLEGQENLCDDPGFTGYQIDGGYAEYAVADAHYCFSLPEFYSDVQVAPLLCAGLIGYRSLRKTGFKPGESKKKNIGIYGFGAAAHIITQVAIFEGHQVYAFTRTGDLEAQAFALKLGATWAGGSTALPPQLLDAAIIFAPVGTLVPEALRAVRKGGVVVAGGIHMSHIPEFPYSILWGERQVVSVANLTRQDAIEFLELAPRVPVKTSTVVFPLEDANNALDALHRGLLVGAAVLVP